MFVREKKNFFHSLYNFLKQQLFFLANQEEAGLGHIGELSHFPRERNGFEESSSPDAEVERRPLVAMVWTADFVSMRTSVCGPALKLSQLRECTLLTVVRAMRIPFHLCLPHS